MTEVELKFENENINGLGVVGSYLIDAGHRLGVEIEADCGRRGECDSCMVKITHGGDLLSAPTSAETEQLSEETRRTGERLSCQAKLEKAGEIVVMTKKTEDDPKAEKTEEEKAEEFKKEFAELPLEKKIANLLDLEFMTLGETFTFVLNSPYKIIEKAMDVLAEFGLKLEEKDREEKRPKEHKAEANGSESPDASTKTAEKKSAAKGSAKKNSN